jgi:quercetin dioxygenase-like cupin family protein
VGDALRFDLTEETQRASDPEALARTGRSARTLLKDGPLRVTLIVLGPGGDIPEHQTEGPITIHVLRGALRLNVEGTDYGLGTGDLLSIGTGASHSLMSDQGAALLLTVAFEQGHGGSGP